MLRQDAGGERLHLVTRGVELARAAERSRRVREATTRRMDRERGRVRAAIVSALKAALDRLEPAAPREPQLGRDAGC
ncbi:MAG TPA: hypothetical protein VLE71_01750 [Actinomycetota bacterium]|nr:hypothetical protein [Actinomycetota bacterium]